MFLFRLANFGIDIYRLLAVPTVVFDIVLVNKTCFYDRAQFNLLRLTKVVI